MRVNSPAVLSPSKDHFIEIANPRIKYGVAMTNHPTQKSGPSGPSWLKPSPPPFIVSVSKDPLSLRQPLLEFLCYIRERTR